MRVRYTLRARADLDQIFKFIEEHSPVGAETVKQAVEASVQRLVLFPALGRPTSLPEIREMTVPGHGYAVFYQLAPDEIRVLHIRAHRRRPLTIR